MGTVEQTFSQVIRCRYVRHGCDRFWKFELWETALAERDRVDHERTCWYRHYDRP